VTPDTRDISTATVISVPADFVPTRADEFPALGWRFVADKSRAPPSREAPLAAAVKREDGAERTGFRFAQGGEAPPEVAGTKPVDAAEDSGEIWPAADEEPDGTSWFTNVGRPQRATEGSSVGEESSDESHSLQENLESDAQHPKPDTFAATNYRSPPIVPLCGPEAKPQTTDKAEEKPAPPPRQLPQLVKVGPQCPSCRPCRPPRSWHASRPPAARSNGRRRRFRQISWRGTES
jgi:hypothetical protein